MTITIFLWVNYTRASSVWGRLNKSFVIILNPFLGVFKLIYLPYTRLICRCTSAVRCQGSQVKEGCFAEWIFVCNNLWSISIAIFQKNLSQLVLIYCIWYFLMTMKEVHVKVCILKSFSKIFVCINFFVSYYYIEDNQEIIITE